MNQTSTREATGGDAAVIASLICDSFRDVARRFGLTSENCPKHPSNCETSWVEGDLARGVQYFIISNRREPVGCAGLEQKPGGLALLERLAVLPQHRSQGLGCSLVQHVLAHATCKGASRLSAAIIADQAELKRWYEHLGFVETGTRTFPHLPFEVTFLEYTIEESAKDRVEDIVASASNPHQ